MNLATVLPLIIFLLAVFNPAFGESLQMNELPTYQNGILTIPRVDTLEQAGKFQDVKLLLTEQGDWRLVEVKVADSTRFHIEAVELIVIESFPFQVFLKANGYLNDGCVAMGKTVQRLQNNRFEIILYVEDYHEQDTSCTQNIQRFENVIPLSVYGLKADTYEYRLSDAFNSNVDTEKSHVNTFTGSFTLNRDNKL